MLFVLGGLALTTILMGALARSGLSSACECVTLSNGVEVLVSLAAYEEIERRHATSDHREGSNRWDEAVLRVIEANRPRECHYLRETLGHDRPAIGSEKVRSKQTVKV